MRSPLTGVVFALELTHRYGALLPLVIGATTAFAVSVLLLKRSVLTEKIARRGYHLSREYDVDPLEIVFVDEVVSDEVLELHDDVTVAQALATLGSPTDPRPGASGSTPSSTAPARCWAWSRSGSCSRPTAPAPALSSASSGAPRGR